jgi:hypothetical protein
LKIRQIITVSKERVESLETYIYTAVVGRPQSRVMIRTEARHYADSLRSNIREPELIELFVVVRRFAAARREAVNEASDTIVLLSSSSFLGSSSRI